MVLSIITQSSALTVYTQNHCGFLFSLSEAYIKFIFAYTQSFKIIIYSVAAHSYSSCDLRLFQGDRHLLVLLAFLVAPLLHLLHQDQPLHLVPVEERSGGRKKDVKGDSIQLISNVFLSPVLQGHPGSQCLLEFHVHP